jgi:hypothetical protein
VQVFFLLESHLTHQTIAVAALGLAVRQRLMKMRLRSAIVISLLANMCRRRLLRKHHSRRSGKQESESDFQLHTGNLSSTSIRRASAPAGFIFGEGTTIATCAFSHHVVLPDGPTARGAVTS